MTRNTGGPAFPLHNHGAQTLGLHVSGMTLRDYFAAKAMHAVMVGSKGHTPAYICQEAYHMADVMLKAREL
jgi:hypothetical protein